jgi:hypothetical protein
MFFSASNQKYRWNSAIPTWAKNAHLGWYRSWAPIGSWGGIDSIDTHEANRSSSSAPSSSLLPMFRSKRPARRSPPAARRFQLPPPRSRRIAPLAVASRGHAWRRTGAAHGRRPSSTRTAAAGTVALHYSQIAAVIHHLQYLTPWPDISDQAAVGTKKWFSFSFFFDFPQLRLEDGSSLLH